MKSLVSLISNRLYDLQIMCNGKEVEVFSAIKASRVEIKALKVMLSQCKNSKFNIVLSFDTLNSDISNFGEVLIRCTPQLT